MCTRVYVCVCVRVRACADDITSTVIVSNRRSRARIVVRSRPTPRDVTRPHAFYVLRHVLAEQAGGAHNPAHGVVWWVSARRRNEFLFPRRGNMRAACVSSGVTQ
ncbi:hypothetical protein EON67_08100 [archaeon]|nr:MAG: hypothetical protein EON67_08100 [archaeon]